MTPLQMEMVGMENNMKNNIMMKTTWMMVGEMMIALMNKIHNKIMRLTIRIKAHHK